MRAGELGSSAPIAAFITDFLRFLRCKFQKAQKISAVSWQNITSSRWHLRKMSLGCSSLKQDRGCATWKQPSFFPWFQRIENNDRPLWDPFAAMHSCTHSRAPVRNWWILSCRKTKQKTHTVFLVAFVKAPLVTCRPTWPLAYVPVSNMNKSSYETAFAL